MAQEVALQTPIAKEDIVKLSVGDLVYVNGVIFTLRDLAHIRLLQEYNQRNRLPEDFSGAVIFHAGPVVKQEQNDWFISVVGPTTSMRMEPFSDFVLGKLGVSCIVGKGGMGRKTQEALTKYCGAYLLSPPGCAVVQARAMRKVLRVHWLDLGVPEALWVIEVKDWGPLTVAMDARGNSIFEDIRNKAFNKINILYR